MNREETIRKAQGMSVSVIIAAFNAELTIERAISSAEEADEILVVDDCSTDGTCNTVEELRGHYPQLRLLKQEVNRGPAAARNRAVEMASGDWVMVLDGDDAFIPGRIEYLLRHAATTNADILADNILLFDDEAGQDTGLGVRPSLIGDALRLDIYGYLERCMTNTPSAVDFGLLKPMIRRALLQRTALRYPEDSRHGEDFTFIYGLLQTGSCLAVLPEAYYRYTLRTGTVSKKRSAHSRTRPDYEHILNTAHALAAATDDLRLRRLLEKRADRIRLLITNSQFVGMQKFAKLRTMARRFTESQVRDLIAHLAKGKLLRAAERMRGSRLFRDTAVLGTGQVLRLGIQAAYFFLIARYLGPKLFGAFAAITAVTAMFSPFSGLGSGTMFLQNVRSGRSSPAMCWGNGLALIAVSGSVLSGIVVLANGYLHLPVSLNILMLICFSDLILMRVTDLASFGFAATGHMAQSATQSVVMSLLRLIAISALATSHQASLNHWIWAYFATSFLGCTYALAKGYKYWGGMELNLSCWRRDLSNGAFFSISTSAQTVYNDIDKTMLGHLSTLSATGIYAAAYRIVDTTMTPIKSLVSAAYPRFFEVGTGGLEATYSYARTLIRKASVFGLLNFVLLWSAAPLIPLALGSQYTASASALRWLALIPFLRCFHLLLADSLSGSGHQKTRTSIQLAVAALNVGFNLLMLPRWSWLGAAWSSLACDGLLVVSMWAAHLYLRGTRPFDSAQHTVSEGCA